MESGEEPTEMTAMTSQDGTAGVSFTSNSGGASGDHRKAWFQRLMKSRQGKCILAVAFVVSLAFAAYVMSKIIMGSMYMSSCQLDPFIPIYLVISASLFIIFAIVLIIVLVKCEREDNDDRVHPAHLIIFVYFFIHLVLQLAGSVCVIRTRNEVADQVTPPPPDQPLPATCDASLLGYAFGVVIFELILSGLFFIFIIISLCEVTYLVCCGGPNTNKPPAAR